MRMGEETRISMQRSLRSDWDRVYIHTNEGNTVLPVPTDRSKQVRSDPSDSRTKMNSDEAAIKFYVTLLKGRLILPY